MMAMIASVGIPAEAVGAIISAVVIGLGTYGYKHFKGSQAAESTRYVTHEQYDKDLKRVYDMIYKNSENLNQLIGAVSTNIQQSKK